MNGGPSRTQAAHVAPPAKAEATTQSGVRFRSIAFPFGPPANADDDLDAFRDLRLDQIISGITAGREEYDLAPLLRLPLVTKEEIVWRQDVLRDLERPQLRQGVDALAVAMRTVRQQLLFASKSSFELEQQRIFLGAAETYVVGLEQFEHHLREAAPTSQGLNEFLINLSSYVAEDEFLTLARAARAATAVLGQVRYDLLIHEGAVSVRRPTKSGDYSEVVEALFARFRPDTGAKSVGPHADDEGMNHVEEQLALRVARLYPEPFAELARFCHAHAQFIDEGIVRFDREVQIFTAYLDFTADLRAAGLPFSYPAISDSKEVHASDTFDLALARVLVRERGEVILNSFELRDGERLLVVTGPNQGGKTTFARAFGQLHYMARLGYFVPGSEVRLLRCDRIFTHFARPEDVANLHGQLESDLFRIHGILDAATPQSILVVNEIFSSTTPDDAIVLGRLILERMVRLDALGVWVTFLDELASFGLQTVSMVAGVDPKDPTSRTFKVERRPAEGLAYALAIAEKHRVTPAWLRKRISR